MCTKIKEDKGQLEWSVGSVVGSVRVLRLRMRACNLQLPMPHALSALSLPGEIRVKVTAAFLAGKCENSQNENQMQTPAGKRQPATAQKNRHLAREVDA